MHDVLVAHALQGALSVEGVVLDVHGAACSADGASSTRAALPACDESRTQPVSKNHSSSVSVRAS